MDPLSQLKEDALAQQRSWNDVHRDLSPQPSDADLPALHQRVSELEATRDVNAICLLLHESPPAIQNLAIQALEHLNDPAALPALGALISASDTPHIRARAARLVARLGGIPHLAIAADDPEIQVIRSAANGLIQSYTGRVLPAETCALLGHPSAPVRAFIAWALGVIGDPAAIAPLAAALPVSEAADRPHIVTALLRLEPAFTHALPHVNDEVLAILFTFLDGSAAAWELLGGPDLDDARSLNNEKVDRITEECKRLRAAAAAVIGATGGRAAVAGLVSRLETARLVEVLVAAAAALGHIGGAEAQAALERASGDPAPEVRAVAARRDEGGCG